jgi:hypothetical protein
VSALRIFPQRRGERKVKGILGSALGFAGSTVGDVGTYDRLGEIKYCARPFSHALEWHISHIVHQEKMGGVDSGTRVQVLF